MPKSYTGLGFSLLYPDTWKLENEAKSSSVSLESPEGAFLTISKLTTDANLESAVEQAAHAMHAEYEDVEQEELVRTVEGFQMTGLTQRFICLDMVVTSHLLSFTSDNLAYLIQIQGEDRDMDRLEIVFDAILTSMCKSLLSAA